MFRFVGLFLRLSASPASTAGTGEPAIARLPDAGTLILLFSAVTLAAVIVFFVARIPAKGDKKANGNTAPQSPSASEDSASEEREERTEHEISHKGD